MDPHSELLISISVAVLIIVIGVLFFRGGFGCAGKEVTSNCEANATSATPALGGCLSTQTDEDPSPKRSAGAAAAAAAGIAATTEHSKHAAKSTSRYFGEVKRFSDRNGMGFISCTKLRTKHGVDVRIYRDEYEAAHLGVGDTVAFNIVLGGRLNCPKNHPWATEVEKSVPLEDASENAEEEERDASPTKAASPHRQATVPHVPSATFPEPRTDTTGGAPSAGASKPKAMLETLKSLRNEVPKAAAVPGRRLTPPCATVLDAKAPEFKPLAISGSLHGSTRLQTSAQAFVPSSPLTRSPFITTTGLRAQAPAFVPRGKCIPTASARAGAVMAQG